MATCLRFGMAVRCTSSFPLLLLLMMTSVHSWLQDIQPNMVVEHPKDVKEFVGNGTDPDYFKILEQDGDKLLVGARNFVYTIQLREFREDEPRRLEWPANSEDVSKCLNKGKSVYKCHNFIRVLKKVGTNKALICGTNAFKPMCREYVFDESQYQYVMVSESPGEAKSPLDPEQDSTAVWVGGELYTATVRDFIASDYIIYREPVRTMSRNIDWLNEARFVGSFAHDDHVYFLFRETAVEYTKCGKAVYSRVARVCKNDRGGLLVLEGQWTSFVKSRLICSLPGDYPFHFNEIQASTPLVETMVNGKRELVFYAVFTTPDNSISGSAVCAFRMRNVTDAFDGPFKAHDVDSCWQTVPSSKVPSPRPGTCVNDSQDSSQLPDTTLNFIKDKPLMDMPVPPMGSEPLLVRTHLQSKFTHITVDPQVVAVDGSTYDVMFVGTSDGFVFKSLHVNSGGGGGDDARRHIVVEQVRVLNVTLHGNLTNLYVYRQRTPDGDTDEKLVVVSQRSVHALPVQHCAVRVSCAGCVQLQDPYCAWDRKKKLCVHDANRGDAADKRKPWSTPHPGQFIQNVQDGFHVDCKDVDEKLTSTSTTPGSTEDIKPQEAPASKCAPALEPSTAQLTGSSHAYSAESLTLAIVLTLILALLIGFCFGYRFSMWHARRARDGEPPYKENNDLRRASREAQHLNHDAGSIGSGGYVVNNKPPVNLVLNVAPKGGGGGKSPNISTTDSVYNTNTLTKAKKVYL
ncbi:PREDICTED: semaphorin-1A-like isoform X2 [Priapulus caudatus]|uniref:Semaphorin-1A-like isoform X2 n=1 Tax=Priapulus caudatus TaxID=37621 RepID=A0ABM1EMC5_PRICU|nr:PREDICTED: semaphorin-1A-like isoform X2 [Priapulus caudatus]